MFQQERLWRVNYKGRTEKLKAFEADRLRAFCEAELIVPVNGDGHKATPVFTDWKETSAVYPCSEWNGWVWTMGDLLSAPDDTIVVNCKSLGFVATKKLLTQMKEANATELQKAGADGKDA